MKNLRILIIDTDLFSLSKIYFSLIHLDHVVEACNCPDEVESRMARFQPRLVVLGPCGNMDRATLCHRLKESGVHLLLVGARRDESGTALPVDGFLEKPVDLGLLHRKIRVLAEASK